MTQKKIITRNHEKPPLTYGPERLHYQYSAILPSLHLTLVSILQGVVFGVLLQGIPLPNIFNADLLNFLLHVYFYLPYVISSLLILLIWKQFVQAAVFSLWPLSTFQAGLTYLIALIEILAFRVIALPIGQRNTTISTGMLSGWVVGIGFIGIVGGIIRLNNLRLEILEDYELEELGQFGFKVEKREGFLYIFLGITMIVFSLLYNNLIHAVSYIISSAITWSILIVLLSFVCLVIILDIKYRQSFLKTYVKGSDLTISSHGVLRYDNEENEEKDPTQELIKQVEILQTQVQALTKKIDVMQVQEQPPTSKAAFKNSLVTQAAMTMGIPLVTWAIVSRVKSFMKRGVRADH